MGNLSVKFDKTLSKNFNSQLQLAVCQFRCFQLSPKFQYAHYFGGPSFEITLEKLHVKSPWITFMRNLKKDPFSTVVCVRTRKVNALINIQYIFNKSSIDIYQCNYLLPVDPDNCKILRPFGIYQCNYQLPVDPDNYKILRPFAYLGIHKPSFNQRETGEANTKHYSRTDIIQKFRNPDIKSCSTRSMGEILDVIDICCCLCEVCCTLHEVCAATECCHGICDILPCCDPTLGLCCCCVCCLGMSAVSPELQANVNSCDNEAEVVVIQQEPVIIQTNPT